MLIDMLNQSDAMKGYTLPQKTIFMQLANIFESNTGYLFMEPYELVEETGRGTVQQWKELLLLPATKNYIKGQMAFIAQVSQRKTFMSLVNQAMGGNAQAAKQVQELSGIMNQQDTNRTIVLHQIPRPNRQTGGN